MGSDEVMLHEGVLLLGLHDEKGTMGGATAYSYALAGALLAELLLQRRVTLRQQGKKTVVEVVDATPVDEPLLDECLERIHGSKKPKTLKEWVGTFVWLRDLEHRIARRLVERGVLRKEEDRILLVFRRTRYPEADPGPEARLVARLRDAIVSEDPDVDLRTVVLLSLARSAGLLRVVFDKKELKRREERIEELVNGEVTGAAAREAIQAMQAAVVATTVAATVITTT